LITAIIRVIIDIIFFIFVCIKLGDHDIPGLIFIIIGLSKLFHIYIYKKNTQDGPDFHFD